MDESGQGIERIAVALGGEQQQGVVRGLDFALLAQARQRGDTRAGAIEGLSKLAAQGLWVELCAGACVTALARLRERGEVEPSHHALLLLTAKGDRDAFDALA